jgi:hypothetical protein
MNIEQLTKIPTFSNKETKGKNTLYHFRVKTIDKWYHHVLTVNHRGNWWWKSLGVIEEHK